MLRDAATVGKLVGILEFAFSDKLARLNFVVGLGGVNFRKKVLVRLALREVGGNLNTILAIWLDR